MVTKGARGTRPALCAYIAERRRQPGRDRGWKLYPAPGTRCVHGLLVTLSDAHDSRGSLVTFSHEGQPAPRLSSLTRIPDRFRVSSCPTNAAASIKESVDSVPERPKELGERERGVLVVVDYEDAKRTWWLMRHCHSCIRHEFGATAMPRGWRPARCEHGPERSSS
jgi:hypothetical protein